MPGGIMERDGANIGRRAFSAFALGTATWSLGLRASAQDTGRLAPPAPPVAAGSPGDQGHTKPLAVAGGAGGVERGRLKIQGFKDPEMEFQLLRGMGVANYGGAAMGELLFAAGSTRELMAAHAERVPAESWVRAHSDLAQATEALGRDALRKEHKVSARKHLLRASMYYRAAEYFCDPYTDAHRKWGLASRAAFVEAAKLLATPVEILELPYEKAGIPVYFFRPDASLEPRKTLIVNTGFDGSGEELYFEVACDGLERGYNVLLLDGPGQTGMTRLHPELKFRPDWEVPMRTVVDWLASQPGVDMRRLGLYGISLGGYFATRAACFEPRIRALAANSPIIDLKAYQLGFFPRNVVADPPELRLEWLPEIPRSELPDSLRALLKIAFYRFGTESLHDWLAMLDAFQTGDFLGKLRIPCLAMVGEAEGEVPAKQAQLFKEKVAGPLTERVFRYEEGADMHCQVGNLPLSNAVLFDWLDDVFA